ncbi:helix-turn-helix domain-containing protein [Acidithiobacillus sp.]|jgi:hypothetical protein|uniref:helix-turn-helix domain-containing protein n=1 Tax=Acidithiobacillus sp. TaxID=1872118 RepID=UPI0025C33EBA|nr:helix-turn-helix transcriptional regulator [Acidithiobacillus sp.]MCK9189238.1 helix-turn-helix domain-containing protein [Acidithiobacillus sp.]MCK9359442.1 helix-turn-helix domain-containing protein [Acidithiobacillus sp.]
MIPLSEEKGGFTAEEPECAPPKRYCWLFVPFSVWLKADWRKRALVHGWQVEAAQRMEISQPKVSALLRGNFSNLSERKPMACLNRLGYDIEIQIKAASAPIGHVVLAVA